jgi:hypothetical protein
MKVGNENYCEQSFNAQATVEVASRLIVGQPINQAPNDKQERVPTLACIPAEAGGIAAALVDSGCFSPAAVQAIKQTAAAKRPARRSMRRWRRPGITGAWLTSKKTGIRSARARCERSQVMRQRLRTSAGKALSKLRQQSVELFYGIIKNVLGFRQFRIRGREKVSLEWTRVCLVYHLKRLHRLGGSLQPALVNCNAGRAAPNQTFPRSESSSSLTHPPGETDRIGPPGSSSRSPVHLPQVRQPPKKGFNAGHSHAGCT